MHEQIGRTVLKCLYLVAVGITAGRVDKNYIVGLFLSFKPGYTIAQVANDIVGLECLKVVTAQLKDIGVHLAIVNPRGLFGKEQAVYAHSSRQVGKRFSLGDKGCFVKGCGFRRTLLPIDFGRKQVSFPVAKRGPFLLGLASALQLLSNHPHINIGITALLKQ